MKVHPIFLHTDLSESYFVSEFNNETVTSRKSYKEYWRRALKKIRIAFIFKRLTPNPVDLYSHYSFLQSEKAPKLNFGSFIISPYSNFYLIWILLLTCFLLYSSTYSLFYYSFIGFENTYRELYIEIGTDFLLVIDILLTFNLGFVDELNRLNMNRKNILTNYLFGMLVFDFISAIPVGILISLSPGQELSLFIVYRHIPKLAKWIKLLKAIKHFSVIKRIDYLEILYNFQIFCIKIFVFTLLTLHIAACVFYLAAKSENFNEDTWISRKSLIDTSISFKYLTSLYWSLVTLISLGYGELNPYTVQEYIITCIWMLIGTFITSILVSKFTVAYTIENKIAFLVDEALVFVEDFSKTVKLDQKLKNKLKIYINNKKLTICKQGNIKFLQKLDSGIRLEVAKNMYHKGITKIGFFENKNKEFLATIAFWFEYFQVKENDLIWSKGCSADCIFFITSGRVRYLYEDLLFYVYKEGEFFGDLEVFYKVERKFNVFTCEVSKFLKIGKVGLKRWKMEFPEEYLQFKKLRKKREKNLICCLAEMITFQNVKSCHYEVIRLIDIEREKVIVEKKLFFDKDRWDMNEKLKAGLKILNETNKKIKLCKRIIDDLLQSN